MGNVKISQLPLYTGNTTGTWLIMNNSGETQTFKVNTNTVLQSGTSGTSGTSGSSGSSGTSGINGSSGTSGTSGSNGSSGTSGTSGSNGSSGTSGSSGSSGTSGSNGSSGTSGSDGSSGTSGSNGSSGTSGSNGSSGTSGDSIFAQTGSFWNTTNNIGITGSLLVSGSANVSGSMILDGSSLLLKRIGAVNQNLYYITSSVSSSNLILATETAAGNASIDLTSGSANIIFGTQFSNQSGYNRKINGSSNIFRSVPVIGTGSADITFNRNINNNLSRYIASGSGTVNDNILGTNTIQQYSASLNFTNNIATPSSLIQSYANGTYTTGSLSNTLVSLSSNYINGGVTLQNVNSTITAYGNIFNDYSLNIDNKYQHTGTTSFTTVANNIFTGNGNDVRTSGSITVNSSRVIYNNLIGGSGNQIGLYRSNVTESLQNTIVYGRSLSVSGSIENTINGSAFFGRYNLTGSTSDAGDIIFAVGTGTDNSNRKTGFLIDTGSNVYITGSINSTGSIISNGNVTISGSLLTTGSAIITGSVQGNVNALSISSNTASLNLNDGNFFTLQLVSGSNTFINPSNIKAGQTINLLLSTTGSATVSFASSVKQVSGSAYVPTSTTSKDILTLVSFDSSNLYLANVKNLV